MEAEMMSDTDLLVHANRAVAILQMNNDEDCAEVIHELIIRYKSVCKDLQSFIKERNNAMR